MRAGIGYDLHRLVEGRKLVLGGVEIPFEKGLLGHSDGDVLLHAIIDALLGAAGLPDIGTHFPPDDPQYEGISSLLLLEQAKKLVEERDFRIRNVDATIVAEEPRLAPFSGRIKQRVAQTLGIPEASVGIKAKTNEGLGLVGKGEAIACFAVALLEEGKPR